MFDSAIVQPNGPNFQLQPGGNWGRSLIKHFHHPLSSITTRKIFFPTDLKSKRTGTCCERSSERMQIFSVIYSSINFWKPNEGPKAHLTPIRVSSSDKHEIGKLDERWDAANPALGLDPDVLPCVHAEHLNPKQPRSVHFNELQLIKSRVLNKIKQRARGLFRVSLRAFRGVENRSVEH